MEKFRFGYNCVMLGIGTTLVISYIMKFLFGISFINDAIYLYLLILIPIMIKVYPYWGGFGMDSPNQKHQLVIKQYMTGLHHFTNNIEIYKKVGFGFKRNINEVITIDEDEVGLINRLSIADGSHFTGEEVYCIENKITFKWIDEDQLEIDVHGTETFKEINLDKGLFSQ